MKIKLCGMRRSEDIVYTNEARPDYIGFVFAKSKRQVSSDFAAELKTMLDTGIQTVGVFVNESVDAIAHISKHVGLHAVQLHGDEDPAFLARLKLSIPHVQIWKAVRVLDEQSIIQASKYAADCLLLDAYSTSAYGGTGEAADWPLIVRLKASLKQPFFLAGGLNPSNIEQAARCVDPYGLDISSGIETGGTKDREKIRAVMQIVRRL